MTTMSLLLASALLVASTAALTIVGESTGRRRLVYVFKPLTTALIILLALALTPTTPAPYKQLILLGLLFSLAGDVFLMLPNDRFVPGLVSFLVAHLFYIAAFTRGEGVNVTWWALLVYLLYGGLMLAVLWPHLGAMRVPVLAYMAVILVMGWQALERQLALGTPAALLAAAGALLFVVSDSVLALDRFRGRFAAARLLVLSTYFAAQWLIAWSVGA
jgi:uncharacterized membrane protein YhhN